MGCTIFIDRWLHLFLTVKPHPFWSFIAELSEACGLLFYDMRSLISESALPVCLSGLSSGKVGRKELVVLGPVIQDVYTRVLCHRGDFIGLNMLPIVKLGVLFL